MVNWLGLTIPFAYLGILIGSLATFANLYRKRKAAKSASLKPWFPPHIQRDVFLSLQDMEPTVDPKGKKVAVPESVLKAALLRRAAEDIRRLLELRNRKSALGQLLQKGSVGDDLWQQFLRAESEMEDEFKEVIGEANKLNSGWGQTIFQSANEMALNNVFRTRLEEIQSTLPQEKEWWDRKRASLQEELMQELDKEGGSTTKKPAGSGAASTATEKTGSDDDAVLVEAGGPAATGGSGGGGGKKKKKGKK